MQCHHHHPIIVNNTPQSPLHEPHHNFLPLPITVSITKLKSMLSPLQTRLHYHYVITPITTIAAASPFQLLPPTITIIHHQPHHYPTPSQSPSHHHQHRHQTIKTNTKLAPPNHTSLLVTIPMTSHHPFTITSFHHLEFVQPLKQHRKRPKILH